MQLLIWGTGCTAGVLADRLGRERIAGFVDSFGPEQSFLEKPIYRPAQLSTFPYDLILVASRSAQAIRETCLSQGVDLSRVLFLKNYCQMLDINESRGLAEQLLGKDLLSQLCPDYHSLRAPEADPALLPGEDLENDYVRLKTLEFLCQRLEDVPGCTAELGVYRGGFARAINRLLPQRRLHLFDTFQGFDAEEAQREAALGHNDSGFAQAHANTCAQQVLAAMPHPEQVVLHIGLFPASLNGLEERFALVSLDVDFEESTLAGLRYFYPRMSPGGYLLLHDYNSLHLPGVKQALARFQEEAGLRVHAVPLCDVNGSLVLSL